MTIEARQRQGSAEQSLAAAQQCVKSSAVRDDETMEQEGTVLFKRDCASA